MDSTTGKQALPVTLNRVKYGLWHGDCKIFAPIGRHLPIVFKASCQTAPKIRSQFESLWVILEPTPAC
jgi:hypothetical protein